MRKNFFLVPFLLVLQSCAFFNTFYNARKSYKLGKESIERSSRTSREAPSNTPEMKLGFFDSEPDNIPGDAKTAFDISIEKTNKVVVLHPTSGWVDDALLLLGKSYYLRSGEGDYLEAKNRLEVLMTRFPASELISEAKLWYGKTLFKLQQFQEAQEILRPIEALNTTEDIRAEANLILGDIALLDENLNVAKAYYAQAQKLAKDENLRKTTLYKSAYCFYKDQKYSDCVVFLNKLNQNNLSLSERFEILVFRSRALKMAGQYKTAIDHLDKILGDPKYKTYFARAEFEIADILRMQGRSSDAEKQFIFIVNTYPAAPVGDCYYMLGLLHDTTQTRPSADFIPDHNRAMKFYTLVRNKYASSYYAPTAVARLTFFEKMNLLKDVMSVNRRLVEIIDGRIKTLESGDTATFVPDEFLVQLVKVDTSVQTNLLEDKDKAETLSDKVKQDLKTINMVSTELTEKQNEINSDIFSLVELTHRDSLLNFRKKVNERLAEYHILLAEYYANELHEYDSSLAYYTKVTELFKESTSEEIAYYGLARIHQIKGFPSYLSLYKEAYEKFPNGVMAKTGETILGLKAANADRYDDVFEEAQMLMVSDTQWVKAADLFQTIARSDSTKHKWPSVYAMGLLEEKKKNNPQKAFLYYNTLLYGAPSWPSAEKLRQKVNAYKKAWNIQNDSAGYTIDTTLIRWHHDISVTQIDQKADSVRTHQEIGKNSMPITTESARRDTNRLQMTDFELEEFENLLKKKSGADSTKVGKKLKPDESLKNKKQRRIKEDESDATPIIKEE
ncbi:MAG TPA: tetratricopeptide repeat protein [bacterium]|nr:tetratricopeptide repeat protein [bacterium]HMW35402.1 tetratricopeptide repeat protein [bacterium]HMY35377.1 tetratricopeptide repeat protein [bacterium]HMZ04625.1 tetratricopeptide repeat protein [bacterium]HNB09038.1 tetratricopeptide repeat protein [bacterium]